MVCDVRVMLNLCKKKKNSKSSRNHSVQMQILNNNSFSTHQIYHVNILPFECPRLSIASIHCFPPLSTYWFSNVQLHFPRKYFRSLVLRSAEIRFEYKIHGIFLLPTNTCGIQHHDSVRPKNYLQKVKFFPTVNVIDNDEGAVLTAKQKWKYFSSIDETFAWTPSSLSMVSTSSVSIKHKRQTILNDFGVCRRISIIIIWLLLYLEYTHIHSMFYFLSSSIQIFILQMSKYCSVI